MDNTDVNLSFSKSFYLRGVALGTVWRHCAYFIGYPPCIPGDKKNVSMSMTDLTCRFFLIMNNIIFSRVHLANVERFTHFVLVMAYEDTDLNQYCPR